MCSAEFYAVITLINSVLFIILVNEVGDVALWFLVYELSILSVIASLTLESRSYRRLYALFVMLTLSFLSTGMFLAFLNYSFVNAASEWMLVLIVSLIALVKVPSFPFSLWLPEAHVEASWPGSVVLAAYALKFSTFAIFSFLIGHLSVMDPAISILLLSPIVGTLGMSSTPDFKKIIANFSIVHMSLTVIALIASSNAEFSANFSWHHHSVVTSWIFMMIGLFYASSSSRLSRFLVSHPAFFTIGLIVFLFLLTLSLDLPWTSNALVELEVFRQLMSVNFLLWIFFVVFFLAVVQSYFSASFPRVSRQLRDTDVRVSRNIWFLASWSVVVIGFLIV